MKKLTEKFQSTHPVRGATAYALAVFRNDLISIHAPRAGCDPCAAPTGAVLPDFNPRTPCGVRRRW